MLVERPKYAHQREALPPVEITEFDCKVLQSVSKLVEPPIVEGEKVIFYGKDVSEEQVANDLNADISTVEESLARLQSVNFVLKGSSNGGPWLFCDNWHNIRFNDYAPQFYNAKRALQFQTAMAK